jgi:segregation and condensation protein B
MEISQIIPHVESLIFASDKPLPVLDIAEFLNGAMAFLEDRITLDQVEAAMDAIREKYASEFYAFEVRESGGGYQFLTKKEYYQTVAQLNGDKFLKKLSTAALETLAIVAYKQPISKGEIEHIRGVSTDYSIQKLLEKELIVISGRSETLPGKPLLYATSKAFMDYFGLNSPKDLPKLKEVFDDETVLPTLIVDGETNAQTEDDELNNLVVSESGELLSQPEQSLNGHSVEELPGVDELQEFTTEETSAEETSTEETPVEDLSTEASSDTDIQSPEASAGPGDDDDDDEDEDEDEWDEDEEFDGEDEEDDEDEDEDDEDDEDEDEDDDDEDWEDDEDDEDEEDEDEEEK